MTKLPFHLAIGLICGLLLFFEARAADKAHDALAATLKAVAGDPRVIAAVRAHNAASEVLTVNEIYRDDNQWQAEAAAMRRPTVDALLASAASRALRQRDIPELLFVTDNRGLLVAASEMTYRYFMDETGLWRQAFVARPGALLTTPAAWHDATGSDDKRLWMSVGIRDPKTQDVIGVVTVEFTTPTPVKSVSAETSPPAPHAATIKTGPRAAQLSN